MLRGEGSGYGKRDSWDALASEKWVRVEETG